MSAGSILSNRARRSKKISVICRRSFPCTRNSTVSENIDFYQGIYQTKKEERRAKKASIIERAELVGREKVLTANLAGSVKQHLALGCALVHDPKIVFLDEPTAGVDPISRRRFWGVIKELSQQGVTTLVTTHYMDEAERCDRVALINDGKIIASDTPAGLKTKEMQGVLLEIDCSQVMPGLEILRRLPVVLDAALYGIYLHIIVDDESCAQNLRDALGQKGIEVRRIERIVPSLEDVFVFLIEEESRTRLKEKLA